MTTNTSKVTGFSVTHLQPEGLFDIPVALGTVHYVNGTETEFELFPVGTSNKVREMQLTLEYLNSDRYMRDLESALARTRALERAIRAYLGECVHAGYAPPKILLNVLKKEIE